MSEKNFDEVLNTDKQETLSEKQSSKNQSKSNNLFNKVACGVNNFGKNTLNGIKNTVSNAKNIAQNAIDKHNALKEIRKKFEQEATIFFMWENTDKNGTNNRLKTIYAIKFPQESYLLLLKSDSINIGTVLSADKGQSFIVTDLDDKTIINYPLNEQVPYYLDCYKVFYQFYQTKSPTVVQQIQNQSVTIHGNNSGDITLVAKQQDDLNTIESAIHSYKPNLFDKWKKNQAIELFGNFKNCIINKQKDQTLFDKFIKVLEVIAPSVVSIAKTLISSII